MNESLTANEIESRSWRDFLSLCKPRVVLLMILTSVVGMCLASPTVVSLNVVFWGNLGIALVAAAAAAVNHFADYRWDCLMARTQHRPIVQGRVSPLETLLFAFCLCLIGMVILCVFINLLTAVLTFLSLLVYAGVYTFYLKHATSQNIVIGGIAGATPPLLGWVAVTGHIGLPAVLLLLIIFVWTPPHFWALAIHRVDEYAKADIPMLPNTHGIPYTKRCMVLYTIALTLVTLLPFAIGGSHDIYLIGALVLDGWFLFGVLTLYFQPDNASSMQVFRHSIIYLLCLFVVLLVDHYCVVDYFFRWI